MLSILSSILCSWETSVDLCGYRCNAARRLWNGIGRTISWLYPCCVSRWFCRSLLVYLCQVRACSAVGQSVKVVRLKSYFTTFYCVLQRWETFWWCKTRREGSCGFKLSHLLPELNEEIRGRQSPHPDLRSALSVLLLISVLSNS